MRNLTKSSATCLRVAFASALAVATVLAPANADLKVHRSFFDARTDAPNPVGKLAVGPSGLLYGFTQDGGSAYGGGTFFKMTTTGLVTTITDVFEINSDPNATPDPWMPAAGPLYISQAGGFFATSVYGGKDSKGTIFKITATGDKTVLHSFVGGANDGQHPYATLLQGSEAIKEGLLTLYGVAAYGGNENQGVIFRIMTDGSGYTILHEFDHTRDTAYSPAGGLAEGDDGYLYGIAQANGFYGGIYRIKKDGTGFGFVYGFTGSEQVGAYATGDLVKHTVNKHIYGTTTYGGPTGGGSIFRINTSTQQVEYVWAFDGLIGAHPGTDPTKQTRLLQGTDGKLYGVTPHGGYYGLGAMFKMDPANPTGATMLGSFNVTDGNGTPNPPVQSGSNFYCTSFNGGITSGLGGAYGDYPGFGAAMSISAAGVVKNIHSFGIQDGFQPYSGVTLFSTGSPPVFFGTTAFGGLFGQGAIYKIQVDASGNGAYSIMHSMNNSLLEGTSPYAALVKAADGNMYGTTTAGGKYNAGTIFKVTSAGAVTVIHHFRPALHGYNPYARLTQGKGTDKNLYGSCSAGGTLGYGTLFSIDTAGKAFKVIHHFTGYSGQNPQCSLTSDAAGGTTTRWLYGTATYGTYFPGGTVFKLSPTGADFTILQGLASLFGLGEYPGLGAPLLHNNMLYVQAQTGGAKGNGTILRVDPNAVYNGGTVVHHFDNGAGEGYVPLGGLVADGSGNLYGVTQSGGVDAVGTAGYGTIYKFNPSTGTFTLLRVLLGGAYGLPSTPYDGLIYAPDGKLYGTTPSGGTWQNGTMFSQTTAP